jgi:hypothetical protein
MADKRPETSALPQIGIRIASSLLFHESAMAGRSICAIILHQFIQH